MTLRYRLTALFVFVILLVSLMIGVFAVITSDRHSRAELNQNLNDLAASAGAAPNRALANVLMTLERGDVNVAAFVLAPNTPTVTLHRSNPEPKAAPSYGSALTAQNQIKAVPDEGGFAMRSLNVGGSSILVLVIPTASVRAHAIRLAWEVGLFALLAASLGALAVQFLTKRDLKTVEELIAFTGDVADGKPVIMGSIEPQSSDVAALKESLERVVQVLGDRLGAVEQTNERMQRFVGDASHELRTPLTTIRGYAELLESPVDEATRHRAVDRISQESRRMTALVEDLLLIAELGEPGQQRFDRVALSNLVASTAETFALDHVTRQVSINVEANIDVLGHAKLVSRLLDNAFSNIARHTNEQDAVTVTLMRRDADAVLIIEDAGPGLANYEDGPQRFRRFDDARSRETGGSGLGLSIMHDIATAMGGVLTVMPSVLGGLKLEITVPQLPSEPE
jgi:two-component system, OmpR family, sensor kinase